MDIFVSAITQYAKYNIPPRSNKLSFLEESYLYAAANASPAVP